MSDDFIFRGRVSELDPDLHELLERERVRQENTVILIPSESEAPAAVEEALGSKFGNIYAEGYPRESSRKQTEAEILDFEAELALYRRESDPRYYKGVEYADVLEALTRRRAAELFAANGVSPDDIYVNVQTLSGGPANSALYTAILKPGDTIMGLNLADGGHLSHGAPVNRSGSIYNAVSYKVDPETESLDYEAIEAMAIEVNPDVIVAGFSAYPLIIDWGRFREIADKVGAHFHADIAHISGLVAAGVHPSPIGIADSVMTTTHKSLCGPRGAMLMTHRKEIGLKIDKAVFPGEQGGGHFNTIAALAVALKLAQGDQFLELQQRIVANAKRLAEKLTEHGLRVVSGRSENHLLLIDCTSVKNSYGIGLDGDLAARILDVAGIVCNRNTIPGDKSALIPSGIRFGTVWISQRGFGDQEIDWLAEAVATLLQNSVPVEYAGRVRRRSRHAKVTFKALQHARELVRKMTKQPEAKIDPKETTLRIRGEKSAEFLSRALTSDVAALAVGESQATHVLIEGDDHAGMLKRVDSSMFALRLTSGESAAGVKQWLQDLSDGYVFINDPYAMLPGPVTIEASTLDVAPPKADSDDVQNAYLDSKPFFVGAGQRETGDLKGLPAFKASAKKPKKTAGFFTHAGATLEAVAGIQSPADFGDPSAELKAAKTGAALFDLTHLSVFSASGPSACDFLNTVTTNDICALQVGHAAQTFLLNPDGGVIDRLNVYRTAAETYLIVANAENGANVWSWLSGVNGKSVLIDKERPFATIAHSCELKDLKADGDRVMLSVEGAKAAEVLSNLSVNASRLNALAQSAQFVMYDMIISRGGRSGSTGFELFVKPEQAEEIWSALQAAGATPAGLTALRSARIELGQPNMNHEIGGSHKIDPDTACLGGQVKLDKPFFIGRSNYIKQYETHKNTIVRWQMPQNGSIPTYGDPVVDPKSGKVIGAVTSSAVDSKGKLTGMALVPMKYRGKGVQLGIYHLNGGDGIQLPEKIEVGSEMPTPEVATVLTRFGK